MSLAKIGSDPEMFVENMEGQVHHAIGLTGGTKLNPVFIGRGAVQEDNVLLEINTKPTEDGDEFVSIVCEAIDNASKMVEDSVKIIQNSSYTYEEDVITNFPHEAWVFGCDPDFNVYDKKVNPPIEDEKTTFRCAGGHVHIGWNHIEPVDEEKQIQVGIMCDYYLGLWSLVSGDDPERRKMYGQAGSIRFKPYGIEYRTLGNFWIFDKDKIKEVHRRSQMAYENSHLANQLNHYYYGWDYLQHTINTHDIESALSMIEQFSKGELGW